MTIIQILEYWKRLDLQTQFVKFGVTVEMNDSILSGITGGIAGSTSSQCQESPACAPVEPPSSCAGWNWDRGRLVRSGHESNPATRFRSH